MYFFLQGSTTPQIALPTASSLCLFGGPTSPRLGKPAAQEPNAAEAGEVGTSVLFREGHTPDRELAFLLSPEVECSSSQFLVIDEEHGSAGDDHLSYFTIAVIKTQ